MICSTYFFFCGKFCLESTKRSVCLLRDYELSRQQPLPKILQYLMSMHHLLVSRARIAMFLLSQMEFLSQLAENHCFQTFSGNTLLRLVPLVFLLDLVPRKQSSIVQTWQRRCFQLLAINADCSSSQLSFCCISSFDCAVQWKFIMGVLIINVQMPAAVVDTSYWWSSKLHSYRNRILLLRLKATACWDHIFSIWERFERRGNLFLIDKIKRGIYNMMFAT